MTHPRTVESRMILLTRLPVADKSSRLKAPASWAPDKDVLVARSYCGVPVNVALIPLHKGVLGLQDPLPVIVPFATVPLPVNSKKSPFSWLKTKSKFTVPFKGTGFAATPIRTPSPVLLALLSSPFPEIDPWPLLLLAIKQTGPCTENAPTGLTTLQRLDTKDTWYVSVPLCAARFPVIAPCMEVPVPVPLLELQAVAKAIKAKIRIKMRFVSRRAVAAAGSSDRERPEIWQCWVRISAMSESS